MDYMARLPYRADASAYFTLLRDLPWPAWLDSGGRGRYDLLVAEPIETLICTDDETAIEGGAGRHVSSGDPFELLRERMGARTAGLDGVPFSGGALGYWSYDLARRYVALPRSARDGVSLPHMVVAIYDWAVVIDHQEKTAQLVSQQRYLQTADRLCAIRQRLSEVGEVAPITDTDFRLAGAYTSNFTAHGYRAAFERIQQYLQAGDCYQVNLAQRFSAPATGDAWPAYLALRASSPAPYSAFLDWPQAQILCASPERFLTVHGQSVETRPIKGTRPRHADMADDARLVRDLASNPKDRAENLMIVDLLRNDLSKCCEAGSVRTPELFEVESYAQVHHLVSTVVGRLRPSQDALDLLRACFPGGSITGAPKQRAMQVIEELEPHRRGVYCGSIGYLGFDGRLDCNIAIRTMVHSGGELCGWAGGGIVADSRWADEYQETFDKARAMLEVMQRFCR